jgi:carbon monoxide dehydrogenase subunit G
MQINSTFAVVAPIDTVWDTIMDFERVAGCVPGARILNKLSDDAYQVGMTVKLGPVTMQYKGLLNVIERNATEHRAVLGGKAQETRGQGTAEATVTLQLAAEDGGTTRGTVNAELSLSGKAAAMGKGVIGSVTEQMMALFADNLQAMISAQATAGAPETGGLPEPRPTTAPATGAEPEAGPATVPVTGAEPEAGVKAGAAATTPAPAAAGSLDALSLAKGIAAEQLSSPGKVLALLAVVACFSYWAGRRSAFRLIRAIERLKTRRA